MAYSREESPEERNIKLFEELDSMSVGEQHIYYSDDHRIHDYLKAIVSKYSMSNTFNQHGKRMDVDFPFRLTMCTGALIVVKIK